MGDLSASDREVLINSVIFRDAFPLEDSPWETGKRMGMALHNAPGVDSLCEIADALGVNPSSVRKRAKKMGIWIEKVWCVSKQGTHQEMWVTNPEGRAALEAWYGE